jgi:hypothetical protein
MICKHCKQPIKRCGNDEFCQKKGFTHVATDTHYCNKPLILSSDTVAEPDECMERSS